MNSGHLARRSNSGYLSELARSQQGPRFDAAQQFDKREAKVPLNFSFPAKFGFDCFSADTTHGFMHS
jgi:hypothetical protein